MLRAFGCPWVEAGAFGRAAPFPARRGLAAGFGFTLGAVAGFGLDGFF